MRRALGNLIGIFALFSFGQAAASPIADPEETIKILERHVRAHADLAKSERFTPPPRIEADLEILRKPWITHDRYRQLADRYRRTQPRKSLTQTAELFFRLARHAFLLKKNNDVTNWIGLIPKIPATSGWQAKSEYLRALLLLQQGDRVSAEKTFARAAVLAEPSDTDVWASATMALARLAFEKGDYERARDFYSVIPKSSSFYEESLGESAWTFLKLNQLQDATTHVDLLYALYPQSRLLPETGYLFGRIYQDRQGFEKGVSILDRLAVRFRFEEEAILRALKAYRGREEEILFEYDPTLQDSPVRAILPPLGRTLFERHPITQNYLAELRELQKDEDELHRGTALIRASESLLQKPSPTTIEGVMLHELANDIERRHLKAEPASREAQEKIEATRKRLKRLRNETAKEIETLIEVDRHIWIHWKSLRGEREKMALEIKLKARKAIAEFRKFQRHLEETELVTDALELKLRKNAATSDRSFLNDLRSQHPSHLPVFERLDQFRAKIDQHEEKRSQRLTANLPSIKSEIARLQAKVKDTRASVMSQARKDIRRALETNRKELGDILGKYLWTLAEAHYRSLREIKNKLLEARKENGKEMADLDERYNELEITKLQFPPWNFYLENDNASPEMKTRVSDAEQFTQAARAFVDEVENRISRQITKDRERAERYIRNREIRLFDAREERREEALLTYKELLDHNPNGEKAPYALYRVAQLHYERAERIDETYRRAGTQERPTPITYKFAIAPLERIRREFRNFPYRDGALYLLGYVLLDTEQTTESISVFRQLVAEYPRSRYIPEVQLRIGEHYFANRDFRRAIPHYQSVLSFGFNYFYDKALYKLAWSNYLIGRYDSAVAHFLILLDYNEELSEERRKRFVQFENEAVEYVAFSMFRSGGTAAAQRIFDRIGWKKYALATVKRMGEIMTDRNLSKEALAAYNLCINRYPTASLLPELLEHRIELLEKLGRDDEALLEKERALRLLADGSEWIQQNASNREALIKADQFQERVTYSLATQYDVIATNRSSKGARKRATSLYTTVSEEYKESRSAYDARYRLGEIKFEEGHYREAVSHYDEIVRDVRFGHHFSDALYSIVIAREKLLDNRGGLDAALVKAGSKPAEEVDHLVHSLENFIQRSPNDERVPKALYRMAKVLVRAKRYREGREKFLALAQTYPESEWSEEAYIAAIDTFLGEEQWQEASDLATKILASEAKISSNTRSKINDLNEGALFKAAGKHNDEDRPKEAIAAYFHFQKTFGTSTLAPKALFNAFAVAKKHQRMEPAQKALELLIKDYPQTPEAGGAQFERALLFDAVFEIEKAVEAYQKVLKSNVSKKTTRSVWVALADLQAVNPRVSDKPNTLLKIASHLDGKARTDIEFQAANLALDEKQPELALRTWRNLVKRSSGNAEVRCKAASLLSHALWLKEQRGEALRYEGIANRAYKKLPNEIQDVAREDVGRMRSAHIRANRIRIEQRKLAAQTPELLASTFKRKAKLLAQLEKSTLDLAKLQSRRASASALFDLGFAYRQFVDELKNLNPPKNLAEEFQKMADHLSRPLEEKAKLTLKRSWDILAEERLAEPYFDQLADELAAAGLETPPPPKEPATWISTRLPTPPSFLKVPPQKIQRPVTSLRGLILLAAPQPLSKPESDNVNDQLERGIREVQSIWSIEQRRKAGDAFRRALFSSPGSVPAAYNLAIIQLYDGNLSATARSIAWLRNLSNAPAIDHLEATFALMKGEGKEAIRILEKGLVNPSPEDQMRYKLVLAYVIEGESSRALAEAQKFILDAPLSVDAHRALALAYSETNRARTAELILRRALEIEPENPQVRGELALLLTNSRDILLRAKLLEHTAKSAHPEMVANWARLAFDVRMYENACREWELATRSGGKYHPDIMKNLKLCQPVEKASP